MRDNDAIMSSKCLINKHVDLNFLIYAHCFTNEEERTIEYGTGVKSDHLRKTINAQNRDLRENFKTIIN